MRDRAELEEALVKVEALHDMAPEPLQDFLEGAKEALLLAMGERTPLAMLLALEPEDVAAALEEVSQELEGDVPAGAWMLGRGTA
jgi:hypothetical protein